MMVGVPGRSKGCLTCRKRRKGCDTERPSCGQCRRLGLVCAGYSRDLVWVNTSRHPTPYSAKPITLSTTLTQSAYECRYLELFWSSYLPNGRALLSNAAQDALGGWSNTVLALYPSNGILRNILLALCMASTGKLEKNTWMVQQGLRLYITALQDMSVALRRPPGANHDSILTAAKLFSLYEAMCGTDEDGMLTQPKSWVAHTEGELSILTTAGPQQYIYGHAHRLFVDGRLHLTITALRARKRSILSDQAWKTIPWQHHRKTPKDLLLDILVEVPGLFEQLDTLLSCHDPNARNSYRLKLMNDSSSCQIEFTDWLARFSISDASRSINSGNYAPIDITDLASVHLETLYWATGILLHSVMYTATDYDTTLPHRKCIKDYCRKIVRAVPYFFLPAVGKFRAHLATFPIIVVALHLTIFDPDEREVEQDLLDTCLMSPEGAAIGKFLASWKKPQAAIVLQ